MAKTDAVVVLLDALIDRGYTVEGGPGFRFARLGENDLGFMFAVGRDRPQDNGVGPIEAREVTLRHPELAELVATAIRTR